VRYNRHSKLAGRHAFLSPSGYHWLGYSDERLVERFTTARASQRGTELHQFASDAIRLGIELPENGETLNTYVNDAIRYNMEPELSLYYSDNCFGHADALGFEGGLLRIHDLKTGTFPSSVKQLEVYAALFCLEYIVTPHEIDLELRIYQSDEVQSFSPFPETIVHIIDKIVRFDQMIEDLKGASQW
jgi:hypothetical protein